MGILLNSMTSDSNFINEIAQICSGKPETFKTYNIKFKNGFFQRIFYGSVYEGKKKNQKKK